MKNLLWKYPIIYLVFFCFGCLLAGFEIGRAIKYGLPSENIEYYLKISGICANLLFGLYFFYCFIKIKKKKASK
jgi:hypothetical protein